MIFRFYHLHAFSIFSEGSESTKSRRTWKINKIWLQCLHANEKQYIVTLQHVYLFITILRNTCFRHQRGFLFPYNCMNAFTEKGIREMIGNTNYPKKGSH